MDAEHRDGRLAVTLPATTRVASLVTAACRASHVAHSSGRIAPRPHCSQVDHDCATLPVTPPSLHLTRSPTLSPSMILLLASRTPGSCVSCRGASLMAAHLFFRRRDAPEILRLGCGASAPPCRWWSILRSSAILALMRSFCVSNPAIAAVMIS